MCWDPQNTSGKYFDFWFCELKWPFLSHWWSTRGKEQRTEREETKFNSIFALITLCDLDLSFTLSICPSVKCRQWLDNLYNSLFTPYPWQYTLCVCMCAMSSIWNFLEYYSVDPLDGSRFWATLWLQAVNSTFLASEFYY